MNKRMMSHSPLVLCILDGWGIEAPHPANAVTQAHLPNWNYWMQTCAHSQLDASGEHVGLPKGQMGNSEVGHTTIGAGRVLMQDLPRISQAFASGGVESLPLMKDFLQALVQGTRTCHVMGLLSSGGVHSHQDHLKKFLTILDGHGIRSIVHCFLDGRDVPPQSALSFVRELEYFISSLKRASIGTVMGRFYGMDRDKRWERTEKAFYAISMGKGVPSTNLQDTIQNFYEQGIYDEFIPPIICNQYPGFQENDGLLMTNFRADRVQQILSAFVSPHFNFFERQTFIHSGPRLGMKTYSKELDSFIPCLFPQDYPSHTLGEVIASHGLHQLRAAETEKYAHVTFFFNGGREAPYVHEDRLLIPSPPVTTYDQEPGMSAELLTERVLEKLKMPGYDLVVLNFANPDMVGHTGNLRATIQALEVIDVCLGKLASYLENVGGRLMITADHGNAEHMQENGAPHTAHTTNLVPFVLVGFPDTITLKPRGGLQDVAPTLLSLLNLPIPMEMTGCSLIVS